VLKEQEDLKVHKEPRELHQLVLKVHQVLLVLKVRLVPQDLKEQLVQSVLKGLKVLQDLQLRDVQNILLVMLMTVEGLVL
jgi:hypothetical protein